MLSTGMYASYFTDFTDFRYMDIWIYGYMALSLFCIIVISADQLLVVHWKASPHLLGNLSSYLLPSHPTVALA